MIAIVAVVLAAVVAVITVGTAVWVHRASSDVVATSAPVAAVCHPGSYEHPSKRDTPYFRGATDVAVCTAKIAWTSEVPINPW